MPPSIGWSVVPFWAFVLDESSVGDTVGATVGIRVGCEVGHCETLHGNAL